jgi:hypothetical protein
MRVHARTLTLGALVLFAACATAGQAPSTDETRATDPQLKSLERMPIQPAGTQNRAVNGDVVVEAMIGTDGRAEMPTMRISGSAATAVNRDDIADWLQRATFTPAMRAGQAVRGPFRMRVELRTTTKRMP